MIEALRKMWPRAPQATIDAVLACADAVFAKYELTTKLRVAHFMAQVTHECGAGTIIRENMNYSAGRMLQIFGVGKHSAKVTAAEARELAGHGQQIAERVYGLGNPKMARMLGNTQAGDGWRFRGNGMLQLTGRESHERIGTLIGVDLVEHPEQLEDPKISFTVAAAEFRALKAIAPADADDVVTVTRRVNGGQNGIAERRAWLRRWKAALLVALFVVSRALVSGPARAHDTLHYVQAPADWQKWFGEAKTTEQSRPRLATQGFVWHSCCNHADQVKTQFRVSPNPPHGDEWHYLDPKTQQWVRIPNDIIHEEDDPTMPRQLKIEGVLFVYNRLPTCFWAPQEGG